MNFQCIFKYVHCSWNRIYQFRQHLIHWDILYNPLPSTSAYALSCLPILSAVIGVLLQVVAVGRPSPPSPPIFSNNWCAASTGVPQYWHRYCAGMKTQYIVRIILHVFRIYPCCTCLILILIFKQVAKIIWDNCP